jgi:hypothetical protein
MSDNQLSTCLYPYGRFALAGARRSGVAGKIPTTMGLIPNKSQQPNPNPTEVSAAFGILSL